MRSAVLLFLAAGVMFTAPARANVYNEKCFNDVVTKKAMLRKYDYKYNWGAWDTITKGEEGCSHVTTQNSTQGTTAGIDPGYTTGYWSSVSDALSSKDPCKLFGAEVAKRDRFVAANADEIKLDIARGTGEHLATYASLAGCSDSSVQRLFQVSRSHFDALQGASAADGKLADAMQDVIANDDVLRAACHG